MFGIDYRVVCSLGLLDPVFGLLVFYILLDTHPAFLIVPILVLFDIHVHKAWRDGSKTILEKEEEKGKIGWEESEKKRIE